MNSKLLRNEYYEDDFYFNEQEYKGTIKSNPNYLK